MKRKLSAILSFLLTTVLLLALMAPTAAAEGTPAELAAQVVVLVNAARAQEGLAPLASGNAALNNAALKRAQEICIDHPNNFTHIRPDGTSASTVMEEFGISWSVFGENIAWGQVDAESVMNGQNGWMNSPKHKANIMDARFTQIGVGVFESGGRLYWVQLFLKERSGGGTDPGTNPGGGTGNNGSGKFWDGWPDWLQFILRYLLFGWIWMNF